MQVAATMKILKRGPHHWTALVTSEGNSAPLADNPIRLVFLQFGYDTAEGSHVALEQEPIVLEWNLSKSTQAITVTPDQTVTVGNHTGKIETVSLSPFFYRILVWNDSRNTFSEVNPPRRNRMHPQEFGAGCKGSLHR